MQKIKTYQIKIEATIESSLSQKELESKLVIALHDTETNYSKLDRTDEELEILDYETTEANPIKL